LIEEEPLFKTRMGKDGMNKILWVGLTGSAGLALLAALRASSRS